MPDHTDNGDDHRLSPEPLSTYLGKDGHEKAQQAEPIRPSVSKVEQEHLEWMLNKPPVPTQHLTPGGTLQREADEHGRREIKERIEQIKERLTGVGKEKDLAETFNRKGHTPERER